MPVAFLIGSNVKVYDAPDRPIYLGASELVIVAGLVASAAVLSLRRRRVWIPGRVRFWLVAFSAVVLLSNPISMLLGRWSGLPLGVLLDVVRWFEYVAVVPIVSVLITRPRDVRPILLIGLVCLLASAAVTLYQAATFDFAVSRPYGLVRSASDVEGRSESNPNTAGALLMMGSLCALAFAAVTKRRLVRIGLFATVLAGVAAMLFTLSRSSVVGFGAGACALPFVLRRPLRSRVKAALLVGVVVVIGFYAIETAESLAARVTQSLDLTSSTTEAWSILQRLVKWNATLQESGAFFIAGIGFGRFVDYFGFVADNLYLELFASTGIVGLLCFLGLVWALARQARELEPSTPFDVSLRAAYLSVLLGLVVANVTAGLLLAPRVSGLFWLLSGLLIKASEWQQLERSAGPPVPLEPFARSPQP